MTVGNILQDLSIEFDATEQEFLDRIEDLETRCAACETMIQDLSERTEKLEGLLWESITYSLPVEWHRS